MPAHGQSRCPARASLCRAAWLATSIPMPPHRRSRRAVRVSNAPSRVGIAPLAYTGLVCGWSPPSVRDRHAGVPVRCRQPSSATRLRTCAPAPLVGAWFPCSRQCRLLDCCLPCAGRHGIIAAMRRAVVQARGRAPSPPSGRARVGMRRAAFAVRRAVAWAGGERGARRETRCAWPRAQSPSRATAITARSV